MWPFAAGSAALGIGAAGPPLHILRALLAVAVAIALQTTLESVEIDGTLRIVTASVLSVFLVVGSAYGQHGQLGWQALIAAAAAALFSSRRFWPAAAVVFATALFFFA
jgi:hypothetical protein